MGGSMTTQEQLDVAISRPKALCADIVSGDTIVSSGKGGTFPQGLIIGNVVDIKVSDSGLDDYAVVEPAVEFDNVSHIFVITEFDVIE